MNSSASRPVLKIAFPYEGGTFGGGHVSSLLLAAALARRGHRPLIISHGPGRIVEEAAAKGLPAKVLPAFRGSAAHKPDRARAEQILAWPAAARTLRDEAIDILHVNDLRMLRTWAAPARYAGVPVVKHWRSNYTRSLSVDLSMVMVDRVIAISDYVACRLPPAVRRKTAVELNPFEKTAWAEPKETLAKRLRERLGLPSDAAVVGVFGNIIERKRTHVLADVLAAVTETASGRPVFGIACGARGNPPDAQLDEKIARFGLESRLLLTGFVSPVAEWMAGCDVVLVPAIKEPFGRTPLEALDAGTPTIASLDIGAAEVLDEHCSVLLPPESVGPWIDATRKLLDEPLRAAQMVAASQPLLERLSPDQHAARIERIYLDLLERRHAGN